MPKSIVAVLGCLTLAIAALAAASTQVRATHIQPISVTSPLDNSTQTNGCHDNPYYFAPAYGWVRSCAPYGAIDTGNAGTSANAYVRGYYWSSATVVATHPGNSVYFNSNCTSFAGTEYAVAFEIYVPDSSRKAGVAFHHLDNYHQNVSTVVSNGAHFGEQAIWGDQVYLCSGGDPISTGPHIHWEAATASSDPSLVDIWGLDSGVPFVNFSHP